MPRSPLRHGGGAAVNAEPLRSQLRESWWFLPTVVAAVLAACAAALIALDHTIRNAPALLAFSGGASAAREVLSTLASGLLTFTALTFSITVVVLVLTSSQFSPRVLRTFLHDRPSKLTLGVFVGTYLFLLTVLLEVRGDDGIAGAFVPRIAVTAAFALTVVAVGFFVYFVHHIAQSVRASTIIVRIGDETRVAIDREYPVEFGSAAGASHPGAPQHRGGQGTSSGGSERPRSGSLLDTPPMALVRTDRPGYVVGIDMPRLIEKAVRAGAVVEVVPRIGDFVRTGATLARLYSDGLSQDGVGEDLDERELRRIFTLSHERSVDHDVAFGIRQLVDVAERAQSPSVNDPTTSVQCVDAIHDLLWRLAMRDLPEGVHTDRQGTVRVVNRSWSWADYVHLAFDENRHWGADSVQMHRRLRHVVDDLLDLVQDEPRRAPLEEQSRLLMARMQSDLPEAERDAVHRTDPTATTPDPRRPSAAS